MTVPIQPDAPQAQSTLAVVLGASEFPHLEPSYSHPAFEASAGQISHYLTSRDGFGLPRANLLSLFNSPDSPAGITSRIRDFVSTASNRSVTVRDILIYYVGHGDFPRDERTYRLYLRSTQSGLKESTCLQWRQLREALSVPGVNQRTFGFIDACFAARAVDFYHQSSITADMRQILPQAGVVVLASSSRDHVSFVLPGSEFTLFSGELLTVLEHGVEHFPSQLTLSHIRDILASRIRNSFLAAQEKSEDLRGRHPPFPQLLEPTQSEGMLANVPLFPNRVPAIATSETDVAKLRPLAEPTADEISVTASSTRVKGELSDTARTISRREILRIESSLDISDTSTVISVLNRIAQQRSVHGAMVVVRSLGSGDANVRNAARRAVKSISWNKLSDECIRRLPQSNLESQEAILQAVKACRASASVVRFLRSSLPGLHVKLQKRAIELLKEKEERLEDRECQRVLDVLDGRYSVERLLGVGAVTKTYLGRHNESGSFVVIRLLREKYAQDIELKTRFIRTARQTFSLRNEHLVQVIDLPNPGHAHNYYVVTAYVDGTTLREQLSMGRRFVPSECFLIMKAIAKSLIPYYENGLCHAGVRPSNIFLTNKYPHVLLGDPSPHMGDDSYPYEVAGIDARRLMEDCQYAAPEMLTNTPNKFSDQYSLGCVAAELLCGQSAFAGGSLAEIISKQLTGSPPLLSRSGCVVGELADEIVAKLLHKNANARFSEPRLIVSAIEQLEKLWAAGANADPDDSNRREDNDSEGGPHDDGNGPRVGGGGGAPTGATGSVNDTTTKHWDLPEFSVRSVIDATRSVGSVTGAFRKIMKEDVPPATIGRFTIVSMLGSGGFGEVFEAMDPKLERRVAIKVMRQERSRQPELFYREAKVLATLNHSGICPVYDVGTDVDRIYVVMPLLQGETLASAIKRGMYVVRIPESVDLTIRVAQALSYAHAMGVVHRDIKPSNIMLCEDGRPVILDFGLSKIVAQCSEITHTGDIVGTPAFMSPEQCMGKPVNLQADIYSLGAVLYQLVCGRHMYSGVTTFDILRQVMLDQPKRPKEVSPDVDSRLDAIIMRMIEKNPMDRYRSMDDVVKDLEQWRSGTPASVRPISWWEKLRAIIRW